MIYLKFNKFFFFLNYLKIIFLLFLIIFLGSLMSIFERKLLGLMQNRYGPNRVGKWGSLQIIADMIKIIFKEDWIPPFSDYKIFILSPIIAFISFIISFSIIPINNSWIIANFNIGILFFLMIVSLSVYSILLAGWSSNNKYSLLGSIRSTAQTISYEIFLGLSIMGVIAKAESFNLLEIVKNQKYIWNVIPQFFGFINFLIASIAICHRHPFDQPESEQELADGYHIEYSGMKFAFFFIGEYISIINISAIIVTLFFGGWQSIFFLPPSISFIIKTFFFIFFFILIRASLSRPRYDQIMLFCWKICLPLSLINLLITGMVILLNK